MEECEPVYLEPFVHQVGGHSHMFSYDSTTVCKPLVDREYHFYQTVPDSLKEFTPAFKGVVEVAFVEDGDGYFNMTIVGPPSGGKGKRKVFSNAGNSPGSSGGEGGKSDSDSDHSSPKRVASKKSSPENKDTKRVTSRQLIEGGQTSEEMGDTETTSKTDTGCSPNPWSIRCHKREMDKMRRASSGPGPKKFILLENVVSQLHCPCILDLKMGTRQHGDDETEAKQEKKIKRCQTTTSSSLGLRVCGMQVYRRDTGEFVCHNKYHGRQLSSEKVRGALYEFLHDGINLRTDLVALILSRLKQLRALLAKQNSFRFYSSSLLIMYDGKERTAGDARKVAPPATAIDKENKGLKVTSSEDSDCSHSSRSSERRSEHVHHGSPDRSRSRDTMKSSSHEAKHRPVDVRMIDFAHTTHQGFHNDRLRSGPDQGYLFGLDNLIQMFEELQHRNS